MLFTLPTLALLSAVGSVKGAALSTRQSDDFRCKPGYELTAYTSTGIGTCTKLQGSNITPGYSAQTVVYVGLAGGLVGLITATLPLTRYLYSFGAGYFAQRNPNAWHNAFPRDLAPIGSDSAVSTLEEHLHAIWAQSHATITGRSLDDNSAIKYTTTDNSTSATFVHQGFTHTYGMDIIPHNETHSTWKTTFGISAPGDPTLAKRTDVWSGATVSVQNIAVDGHYNAVGLNQDSIKQVADDMTESYLNGVTFGNSVCCNYFGSAPHAHRHFALEVIFASQENYDQTAITPYCDGNIYDVFPDDELW